MIKISQKVQYGLRAMIYLAQSTCPVSVKEISQKEGVSYLFLEKIFSQLRQDKLVLSKRGAAGGYYLRPSPITLGDIVRSLEGDFSLATCLSPSSFCPKNSKCLAKSAWARLQASLNQSMDSINLTELAHA